jgi:hypothetical protein
VAAGCLIAYGACQSTPQASGTAGPRALSPASPISEVALERRCFGCDSEYKLTFRRDGTATRTSFGNARRGTADRSFKGAVSEADFAAVATLMQSEKFFELSDAYRDPGLADGEWATTSAVLDGRQKAVLNSNRAGPPALQKIEDALDALGKKVAWTETP